MTVNLERLKERFEVISRFGKIGDTGVCRPALSKTEREAFDVVAGWMEQAGMTVRVDHFGNLIGRLEGKNPHGPVLMIGSHLDSQPYGGRFDGTAGVLGGLEAVTTMAERGIVPEVPVEVVSFCDEEGWRFQKGLFGSRGITGRVEPEELELMDRDGITRRQALRDFGCDPDKLHESVYMPGQIGAYLELHIEQGPVLERQNRPVGIVSGIAGPLWLTVTLKGHAGHAGSVPMRERRDALVGAAEIVVALNRMVQEEEGVPTVGTVGALRLFPNSPNVIPEEVEFTVDLRDIDMNRRRRIEERLCEAIAQSADRHGLAYSIRESANLQPRYCAEWMKRILHEESQAMGLEAPELMSGPFHDALVMADVCDFAMIFVRCRNGVSHSPEEYASYEDLALGTELLYRGALRISDQLSRRRRPAAI